jgi:hypothetical protein
MVLGVAVGIALTVMLAAGVIGYVISTYITTPGEAVIQEPSKTPSACAEFCAAWERSRLRRCLSWAALKAAYQYMKSLESIYYALLAAAAALFAAAAAAAYIPFIGAAVAAGIFAAATTAAAAAAVVFGLWIGALVDVANKVDEDRARALEEALARLAVFENCSPAEAAACLASPKPCEIS